MSDDENFLSRWARRKREVADSERAESETPALDSAAPSPPADAAPAAPASQEPEFDLSKLPSLESITAATDVSAFMQAGVPAALRHAALRRAWVADPAIRDFVGLAENAWDFTDPNAMAGFGALDPGVDVKKLVAEIFRDATEPPAEQSAAAETATPETPEESPAQAARDPAPDPVEPQLVQRDNDVAMQQEGDEQRESDKQSPEPVRLARKHGGALPR
jgi:hypothetical protein